MLAQPGPLLIRQHGVRVDVPENMHAVPQDGQSRERESNPELGLSGAKDILNARAGGDRRVAVSGIAEDDYRSRRFEFFPQDVSDVL